MPLLGGLAWASCSFPNRKPDDRFSRIRAALCPVVVVVVTEYVQLQKSRAERSMAWRTTSFSAFTVPQIRLLDDKCYTTVGTTTVARNNDCQGRQPPVVGACASILLESFLEPTFRTPRRRMQGQALDWGNQGMLRAASGYSRKTTRLDTNLRLGGAESRVRVLDPCAESCVDSTQ